jgi:hypothetical protein
MSRQYVDREERRRSARVAAYQAVHLRLGPTYCTGRMINLSTLGALVELDRRAGTLGSEVSLGFPLHRSDEACWVLAVACRRSDRMIGMHWCGKPPADVMARIEAMIRRERDPLQPAEARLAALRARCVAHGE